MDSQRSESRHIVNITAYILGSYPHCYIGKWYDQSLSKSRSEAGKTDNRNTKMAVLTKLFPRTHFVPRIFFFTVFLVVVPLWDKLLKRSSCWIKTWSTPASAFKVLYTVTDVCLICQPLYNRKLCGSMSEFCCLFKNLYSFILFVWICLWGGDYRSQKVCQIPETGGLQKVLSFSVWVLRAEFGSWKNSKQ